MVKPKKCYIDCTDTFNSGLNTGIQRVIKNIIARISTLDGFRCYTFVPVISVGSELFALDVNYQKGYFVTRCANRLLGAIRNALDRLFAVNNKDLKSLYCVADGETAAKTDRRNRLARLHAGIVSNCRNAIPFLLKLPLFLDTLGFEYKRVQLKEGDVFFLADSFWNANSLQAAQTAKARKCKIILLVYDIIPITHPAFVADINCSNFVEYLPQYLNIVDGIVSISKYTMSEVDRYCKDLALNRQLKSDYFYLGSDLAPNLSGKPENQLVKDFGAEKIFLMVGTIEPRKNHVFVIDAFERLWNEGSTVKLCLVGKVGWKCDAILKKITDSRYFNKNMFLYTKLDDASLSYCLERACAVIMASIVEGFGLPLIEAIHFGKTVLASDIPVFREIGEDYPLYFPLEDHDSLIDCVLKASNNESGNACHAKGWMSWDESISVLFDKVISMAES